MSGEIIQKAVLKEIPSDSVLKILGSDIMKIWGRFFIVHCCVEIKDLMICNCRLLHENNQGIHIMLDEIPESLSCKLLNRTHTGPHQANQQWQQSGKAIYWGRESEIDLNLIWVEEEQSRSKLKKLSHLNIKVQFKKNSKGFNVFRGNASFAFLLFVIILNLHL